jgi:hypothetical protein
VNHLARALLEDLGPDDLAELADLLRPYLSGDDGWLGTREAAAYAGCTVPALRYAVRQREVEYEQRVPGGKTYFRRADLDRWRAHKP